MKDLASCSGAWGRPRQSGDSKESRFQAAPYLIFLCCALPFFFLSCASAETDTLTGAARVEWISLQFIDRTEESPGAFPDGIPFEMADCLVVFVDVPADADIEALPGAVVVPVDVGLFSEFMDDFQSLFGSTIIVWEPWSFNATATKVAVLSALVDGEMVALLVDSPTKPFLGENDLARIWVSRLLQEAEGIHPHRAMPEWLIQAKKLRYQPLLRD